jgi:hypothetical protein
MYMWWRICIQRETERNRETLNVLNNKENTKQSTAVLFKGSMAAEVHILGYVSTVSQERV